MSSGAVPHHPIWPIIPANPSHRAKKQHPKRAAQKIKWEDKNLGKSGIIRVSLGMELLSRISLLNPPRLKKKYILI